MANVGDRTGTNDIRYNMTTFNPLWHDSQHT